MPNETAADEAIRQQYLGLPGRGVGASDPATGVTAAGHRAVFEAFLHALAQGVKPSVDGLEARKAVEIILAMYQSGQQRGVPVTLPIT